MTELVKEEIVVTEIRCHRVDFSGARIGQRAGQMSAARVGGLASNQLYRMYAFNFFEYREGPLGYLYASLKLVAGRCIVRLQCRWTLK